MGYNANFGSIFLFYKEHFCFRGTFVKVLLQIGFGLLYERKIFTIELRVVIPFQQDWQIFSLHYSQVYSPTFKQLNSPDPVSPVSVLMIYGIPLLRAEGFYDSIFNNDSNLL